MNIQYIRKKHSICPRTIKELIILEERLIGGNLRKEHLQKLSNLYKQIMDYCEKIKEPLKMYFQEKLEYLFLNEKIFKMLLNEDNKKKEDEDVKLLGNSFLKFSEIQNDKDSVMDKFILTQSIDPVITESKAFKIVEGNYNKKK